MTTTTFTTKTLETKTTEDNIAEQADRAAQAIINGADRVIALTENDPCIWDGTGRRGNAESVADYFNDADFGFERHGQARARWASGLGWHTQITRWA